MAECFVGGVTLPHGPFMIGAGVCKNPKSTQEWLKVAPVVSGSYTPESREGNKGKLFYPDTLEEVRRLGYGLNSFGMPNMGFVQAATELAKIVSDQPLFVSVAGFKVAEYWQGISIFQHLDNVDAIELNFGCPNTDHGEIMSFNCADLRSVFEGIAEKKVTKPIWVKFSPFSNPNDLTRAVNAVNGYSKIIQAVVTANTFPGAYAGEGTIICEATRNCGGKSGPALKTDALGQVKRFRELLDSSVDVIGVGGIMSGDEILEYLDAGAKAVQMTSWPFWAGNPGRFVNELMESERFNEYLDLNHS